MALLNERGGRTERESSNVSKRLGQRPTWTFHSFMGWCRKCKSMETVDVNVRRNGQSRVLQVELGGRVTKSNNMEKWAATGKMIMELTHTGCGGQIKLYGKLPEGFDEVC